MVRGQVQKNGVKAAGSTAREHRRICLGQSGHQLLYRQRNHGQAEALRVNTFVANRKKL
jgi:hypothetical protein